MMSIFCEKCDRMMPSEDMEVDTTSKSDRPSLICINCLSELKAKAFQKSVAYFTGGTLLLVALIIALI